MREPTATLLAQAQGQMQGNVSLQLPARQLGGAQQSGALNTRDIVLVARTPYNMRLL